MNPLKLAVTQYGLIALDSHQQFWDSLKVRIDEAASLGARLLLLPEYMTAHLLSLEPDMDHSEACRYLDRLTADYVAFFQSASRRTDMAILAGTHICLDAPGYVNKAFLFFPDGRLETQTKLHLTPEERNLWGLAEGDELRVIETEWGRTSILTCYDMEFPELGRLAAYRGAELLLCPSYTDSAHGYHRVRSCCQARAVENQLFVALSGLVGSLPDRREQVDQGYCQAGLFAPSDFPFPADGVLASGDSNRNQVIFAEADFTSLHVNRSQGAVAPFFDRRQELYDRMFRATVT